MSRPKVSPLPDARSVGVTDTRAGMMDPDPFCIVYQDVITSPEFLGLPRSAVLAYLYIGSHTGGQRKAGRAGPTSHTWRLSIARLQAQLRLSRSQLFAALAALTKAGLLSRKGTRTASWFILHDPPGVGDRRGLSSSKHSKTKHSKRTWLGVTGITVREEDGSPVGTARHCAALVGHWEAAQGRPVTPELFSLLGFVGLHHPAYLAAYPGRYPVEGSGKSDSDQSSDLLDVGRRSKTLTSDFPDPLETTLGDPDLEPKNHPIPSGDGDALEGPIDNPGNSSQDDTLVLLLADVMLALPLDGRPLGHFTATRIASLSQDAEVPASLLRLVSKHLTAWQRAETPLDECGRHKLVEELDSILRGEA